MNLLISVESLPIFFEEEFMRLSDKRNLLLILFFDSNSYKFIT